MSVNVGAGDALLDHDSQPDVLARPVSLLDVGRAVQVRQERRPCTDGTTGTAPEAVLAARGAGLDEVEW